MSMVPRVDVDVVDVVVDVDPLGRTIVSFCWSSRDGKLLV